MSKRTVLVQCLLVLCLLLGCTQERQPKPAEAKELVIFCGITMIGPVKELMEAYEKKTGIKSIMSYGGSKDLLNAMTVNKSGDVYFPGSESLFAEAQSTGQLKERRTVGANQAALFVQKGNPKGLKGDLAELLRPGLRVALGHPDLGSVGKEARDILTRKGSYEKVVALSAIMLPDSKALSAALREGKVDVVLNWKAVLHTGDNAQHMEMLALPNNEAGRHELSMATTIYSTAPEAALNFLEFCASPQGRAVFEKHGF